MAQHSFRIEEQENEKGAMLLIVTVALVAILGLVTLAVDASFLSRKHSQMQNANDLAALAIAAALQNGASNEEAENRGLEVLQTNLAVANLSTPGSNDLQYQIAITRTTTDAQIRVEHQLDSNFVFAHAIPGATSSTSSLHSASSAAVQIHSDSNESPIALFFLLDSSMDTDKSYSAECENAQARRQCDKLGEECQIPHCRRVMNLQQHLAKQMLSHLSSDDAVSIISFGRDGETIVPLTEFDESKKTAAIEGIEQIAPENALDLLNVAFQEGFDSLLTLNGVWPSYASGLEEVRAQSESAALAGRQAVVVMFTAGAPGTGPSDELLNKLGGACQDQWTLCNNKLDTCLNEIAEEAERCEADPRMSCEDIGVNSPATLRCVDHWTQCREGGFNLQEEAAALLRNELIENLSARLLVVSSSSLSDDGPRYADGFFGAQNERRRVLLVEFAGDQSAEIESDPNQFICSDAPDRADSGKAYQAFPSETEISTLAERLVKDAKNFAKVNFAPPRLVPANP